MCNSTATSAENTICYWWKIKNYINIMHAWRYPCRRRCRNQNKFFFFFSPLFSFFDFIETKRNKAVHFFCHAIVHLARYVQFICRFRPFIFYFPFFCFFFVVYFCSTGLFLSRLIVAQKHVTDICCEPVMCKNTFLSCASLFLSMFCCCQKTTTATTIKKARTEAAFVISIVSSFKAQQSKLLRLVASS